jgi:tetratricopeptide (TPR) repeat protein
MKNLIYIFSFVLATTAISQNTTSIAFEKQKLQQAKAYGDESIVANSMYALIALEGPQSTYKDSLAYIYFSKRNYVSCFLVTNDLLKTKPDNLDLLEMNAVSLETIGALDKAKESYEKLLAKTNDNYHAYKLAGIQFRMNENETAYATIKKAAQLPSDGDLKITFQVNENYSQNVDLKAAIAYLEGVIAISLKKNVEAKASFERAIVIFPDFVLAKSKLEVLNAQEAEKN